MDKPKMIMFDYGNTLLCEPMFNTLKGQEALSKYIKSNKNNLSPTQINVFSENLFGKLRAARESGFELHEWQFERFLYEYLEIELSITFSEAEKVFWDNTSSGEFMPNVDRLIDYLNENGIRSGVISNISFSGSALRERINRLLPRNKFEFIIASSEYMFRKPNPMLFELALKKAHLPAKDVWFCGDTIKTDIDGAASAGIFPVWYEDEVMENPWRWESRDIVPQYEHLHIHDWNELIELLDRLS